MSSLGQALKNFNAQIRGVARSNYRTGEVFCIDHKGQNVVFCNANEVAPLMNQLEFTWAKDFAAAQDLSSLAFAFAKFYYAFIAIHPFVDGNQRTAIKFIEDVALDRGYQMQPTPLLRKVHLQGNVPEELKKLTIVFYQALGESK